MRKQRPTPNSLRGVANWCKKHSVPKSLCSCPTGALQGPTGRVNPLRPLTTATDADALLQRIHAHGLRDHSVRCNPWWKDLHEYMEGK